MKVIRRRDERREDPETRDCSLPSTIVPKPTLALPLHSSRTLLRPALSLATPREAPSSPLFAAGPRLFLPALLA